MSESFERAACAAMGTRFEVVIAGCDAPRAQWGAIAEDTLGLVSDWHGRLTRFERGSYVRWLADQPSGEPIGVDRDFAELLGVCARVWSASGGALDVAGGRFGDVTLDARTPSVMIWGPGVVLDFGAVAKGFVIDLVIDELRAAGVTNAIVHGGTSTVRAIGPTPDGRPWAVRVGDGDDAPVVGLVDGSLSVSRNDGGAPVAGHVIDPKTGQPAAGAPFAAVLGESAAVCDAWSTALIVTGAHPGAMDSQLTSILPRASLGDGGGWDIQGPGAHAVRLPAEVGAA
ncbi:MAG: hypothetical protein DHS20C14_13750 [Phycisphaeraceae bacterium]|nr:MAG: hypothetical protein DHS20C14_13750 [Phycisphaeraceae bacterium]